MPRNFNFIKVFSCAKILDPVVYFIQSIIVWTVSNQRKLLAKNFYKNYYNLIHSQIYKGNHTFHVTIYTITYIKFNYCIFIEFNYYSHIVLELDSTFHLERISSISFYYVFLKFARIYDTHGIYSTFHVQRIS